MTGNSDLTLPPNDSALVFAHFIRGFRPDSRGQWRGPAAYRGGNNPTALAIDAQRGVWYDHVTAEGGDCIALVQRCLDTDFRSACRAISDIIGRDLLDRYASPQRPRFGQDELAQAELFRVGLRWNLERSLTLLKDCLWDDLLTDKNETRIKELTQLLAQANTWTPYEAAGHARELKRSRPKLVAGCIAETREMQLSMARSIVSMRAGEVAA